MYEQMDFFNGAITQTIKNEEKKKRKWENGFQNWSNDKAQNDETTPEGKCGYGSMCDFCEDNSYGRPCVRALNAMCREKGITLNYDSENYETIWNGGLYENEKNSCV